MTPFKVGILGATGLVGQRLVERLTGHPWFRIESLAASSRSAGRTYGEAVDWKLSSEVPRGLRAQTIRCCTPDELQDCDFVFSGLDASVAREAESAFAAAGFGVVSNSSAFRLDDAVPLMVPEINASHAALVERQRRKHRGGFIVTNPNCSAIGLALVVAPLHRAYGVRRLIVTTLQAVSGAGLSGPGAIDLVDNVLPHIPGEESKIERELRKILGRLDEGGVEDAEIVASAHCHRVATIDGHLEAVSIELEHPVDPARVVETLSDFRGDLEGRSLPSAPDPPLVVRSEPDRPQPRLDRDTGDGMTVVVGRVRPCPVLGLKLELLCHNTIRGAAGGTLLNAELLAAEDLLPRRVSA